MSAELAARRTAAAAVAADFDREIDAYLDRPPGTAAPDFNRWAFRMRAEIRSLLDGLEIERPAGQLAQIRLVLDSFDWETDDRQYALEQIDDILRSDPVTADVDLAPQTRFEAAVEDYADLRSWGLTRRQAAERMHVSLRTIERYEAALRGRVGSDR